MKNSYRFETVEWLETAGEIMEVRTKVFVVEQRFDKETLCDQFDGKSFHILARNYRGEAVGCGRLVPDGRIGKIAVLINHRGKGIGTMLLGELIEIAQMRNISNVTLNTETQLSSFYDQQKFRADGPVYMKQGIPHQRMRRKLAG